MADRVPTVSVIIPTYNRAYLLGRAIQSVLDQTYQDFEVIVVDDASSDNTEEVVKSFNDERIRYIRHVKNKGEAAARNTGIKIARGEYIASHDSDDEWLPEKLEKQMKVFETVSLDVGVVYTGFWRVKGNKRTYIPLSRVTKKDGYIYGELLKGNFVGTPTTLIKRVCFERAGMFDERLPHLVDWEMWLRISKIYRFKCITEPLVIVYYTLDSISANRDALIEARKLILEKHFQDLKRDRRLLASHQYSVGNLLCQSGDMVQGRDYLLKAAKSCLFSIKYLIAAFVSLFGEGPYTKIVRLKRRIRPTNGNCKDNL